MGSGGVSTRERRSTLALSWQAARLVCLLLLGAILLVSALGKFDRPRSFLGSVLDYRLLPRWMSYAVASTLPGIELLAGLTLFAGLVLELRRLARGGSPPVQAPAGLLDAWVDAAAWLSAAMLLVFIAGMSVDIVRGIRLDCGCFDLVGSYIPFLKSSKVGWGTVLRDVVMLALVVPILARRNPARS